MSNAWGQNSWGYNEWGNQGSVNITITAPSTLTSAIGSVIAYNAEGWGRQEWGNSAWGVDYSVSLTGQQASTSLGTPTTILTVPLTAPSGLTSSIGSPTLDITSIAALTAPSQMTSQLGDFDNAGTMVGWGRNGWGEEPYGDSWNKLVQPAGLSATSSVGSLTTAVENFVPLTAPSEATTSVGSPTLDITSVEILTAPSGLTSSVGAISPTEMVVGLTGQSATSSIGGIILDAVEIGLEV